MLQGFCLDWLVPTRLALHAFAYTGGCVEAVRIRSKAQPRGLGLGHRSSNVSLEILRKYDLESQFGLRGMPCTNAHGDFQNPGLLGNMDVGAGRRSWNFSGSFSD